MRGIFIVAALLALACVRAAAAGETVNLQVLQAEKLIGKGENKDAVALLDAYIAQHPRDARALADRGDAYEALGDQTKAIANYTDAIAADQSFAYAYASRCQSLWETDRDREALDDCNAALELKPEMVYALRQRALVELDLKNVAGALADAEKAVALAPGEAFSLATRCQVYDAAARYADAIRDCSAAIAVNDRNDAPRFYRGRAEIQTKQWNAAIADFSTVIGNDPQELGAYYWRALARANAGDYTDGLDDVDRYLHVRIDDADAYLLRARIQIGLGNRKEAQTAATDALRHYRIDNDEAGAAQAQAVLDGLNVKQ